MTLQTLSGLSVIDGFDALTTIGDGLYIRFNHALTSITGFNQITNISEIEIEENEDLTHISGLQNLETIEGNVRISFGSIENMEGLNNLTSIGGYFVFWYNNTPADLIGLENLTTVGGDLLFRYNDDLTSLSFLNNLTTIGGALNLKFNDNLSDCSIQAICDHISINGSIDIEDNASGCNSGEEILQNCLGFGFSGYTFYDFNQNGVWDDFEGSISMQEVLLEPLDNILFTNQNGRYFSLCDDGQSYTFSLVDHPDWELTTDSASYSVLFETNDPANQNNNFGLYPTYEAHNLAIFTTLGQARCNTDVAFSVDVCNEGTFLETDGLFTINYNELVDYVSAVPAPFLVDEINHRLMWSYDTLYPYQCKNFKVTFTMPSADFIGEDVDLTTNAFIDSLGSPVLVEQKLYRTELLCSFDPNDKLVEPRGEQDAHYTLKEEKLDYTIRFQNTGNISALEVTILDTLDTNLDWSTFRVLQASHPVQTTLTQEGVITFFFEDINLPDSISNPLGSQGFVRYIIAPISGLADDVVVENTAYIIFDQNPAIITNTAFNTYVDEIPMVNSVAEPSEARFQIFPNPTKDKFTITAENEAINQIVLYNAFGEIVKKKQLNATLGDLVEIAFNNLPTGCYFVQVYFKNGSQAVQMVVKQ